MESALRRRGAVLIEGARGCGKTWTARRFARSEARLDDEGILLLAASDPSAVLRGPTPRLLDEWQNAP
ncbi:MAG: ATP-binding protein, partial [bacterium]|nr:ATP-binding protein [bacterium]